jgi:hypothetical protein
MTTLLLLIHVWTVSGATGKALVTEEYAVETHVPGYWPDDRRAGLNLCEALAQRTLRQLQYGSLDMPALLPGATAIVTFKAHCATEV